MRGVKVAIALLVIGLIGTGAVLWWMLQHGFDAISRPRLKSGLHGAFAILRYQQDSDLW